MPTRLVQLCAHRTIERFAFLGVLLLHNSVGICQLPTQEPLARCELQKISPEAATNMGDRGVSIATSRQANGALDEYQRGFGAQWSVPTEVDPSDSNVRLLLLTPAGPFVVAVAIELDGQPFRAVREAWIDNALASNAIASPEQNGSDTDSAGTEIEGITSDETSADRSAEEFETNESEIQQSDPAESSKSKDGEAAEDETDEDDQPEEVESRRHESPRPESRLAEYARVVGGEIDRAEARWLLAEWAPGPALLQLRDGFGWERVAAAPLVAALDLDEDGILSSGEIEQAGDNLRRRDRNEDDTIDYSELTQATGSLVNATRGWKPPRLLVVLDSDSDWDVLFRTLQSSYSTQTTNTMNEFNSESQLAVLATKLGVQSAAALSPTVLTGLLTTVPDIRMTVNFGKSEENQAGVTLLEWHTDAGPASEALHVESDVITAQLTGCYLEITATIPTNEMDAVADGQISLGAVVDGSPLWRVIDADGDSRLSRREVQELEDYLTELDDNGDGQIGPAEIDTPIRLALALGPHVHRVLERPVRAARRSRARERPAAPDWFAAMDANRDGDLARSEFFGTNEQFQSLDVDGDGLVSVRESLAAESTTGDSTGKRDEPDIDEGPIR